MNRSIAAVAAVTVLVAGASKQEPPPRTLDELKSAIARVLHETNTHGAGIAMVTRDRVLLADGIGMADAASKRPATGDTLFRIGSVSKAFASLSILKLQEENRLRLDDPVRRYAPDVTFVNRWEATDPIRIVHLLEHTTGWDDLHLAEYASSDPKPLTLFEGLQYHPDSRTSRWRPGTRMAYCNAGPAVAAYVVERVTGKRFEDYVQENLFTPLHMDTASYLLTPEVRRRLTTLYSSDGQHVEKYWHISLRPAGAINASPRDMANYVMFYLNRGAVDGRRIVKPESIDRMERPESTMAARDGLRAGYGLSNYTSIDGRGFVWHGHDGGITGGLTQMAYLPDAGVGYAYMINATNGEAFGRIHGLITAYLTRDLAAPAKPAPAQPDDALDAQYAGWYEPASPRVQMTYFIDRISDLRRVTVKGAKLRIRPFFGHEQSFAAAGGRLWREERQPPATLALISDLRDGRFIEAGMGEVLEQVPAWQAWLQTGVTAVVALLLASAGLYALYWVPALLLRRLRPLPGGRLYLSVRALPLVAIVLLAGACAVFALAGDDAITKLGSVTLWSAAIFLLTVLFACVSVMALVQAMRARRRMIRRAVWMHSLLVSAACLVVAGYLAYWGVIGIRTWG
ncbi:MAG TPA: serine hydrolase domain-containing protein [Bryobacteraceae bacterium]|nr:serine hydrolase domain-containing protein [Bryobacteraceae bacterium]